MTHVRYYAEASMNWHPGREVSDVEMAVTDLPPQVQRQIRELGSLEALWADDAIYHWEALGIDLWWWVRPI